MEKELRRRSVTRLLLWEEYRAANPDGFGYTWFCTTFEAWKKRVRPSMRQTHIGGEKVFVDFAGDTMSINGLLDPGTSEVGPGAEVAGATVNAHGRLVVRATRVGADTALAQIVQLVEHAQSTKPAVQKLADQIAAKGIKVIDGDVVGDDTYFAFQRYGEGWSQNDLVDEYSFMLEPILLGGGKRDGSWDGSLTAFLGALDPGSAHDDYLELWAEGGALALALHVRDISTTPPFALQHNRRSGRVRPVRVAGRGRRPVEQPADLAEVDQREDHCDRQSDEVLRAE